MGRGLGRTTLSGRRSRVWSFLAPALGISSLRVLNPSPIGIPQPTPKPTTSHTCLVIAGMGRICAIPHVRAGGHGRWDRAGCRAVGFLVSLASQPHGSPRTSARSGVLPFLGVVEAGHLPCRVVRFPPPVGPGPVCHLPSVAGAVEAFFAGRDLASGTCRTYRQALGPLVEAVGSDRAVTSLDADQVAAVFEELWADRAAATWNTRRVAVQAFASWCGGYRRKWTKHNGSGAYLCMDSAIGVVSATGTPCVGS